MTFKISEQSSCGFQRGDIECFSGIIMDCDEYHEGYQHDVIYPPCSCHPKFCKTCKGSGRCPEDLKNDSDDCPACDGDGWIGEPEHPDDRYSKAEAL